MINIDFTTLSGTYYNDDKVDFILSSLSGEIDYNNIIWKDKSLLSNIYFGDSPYFNIPMIICMNQYDNVDALSIPEYVSHNLVYSKQSSKGYVGQLTGSCDELLTSSMVNYAIGTLAMVCNDDVNCLFCVHWGGSSGCGKFKDRDYEHELNSTIKQLSFEDQWYRDEAAYAVDGCFSSKIIHIPANATTITIDLNKYGTIYEPCKLDGWYEVDKKYSCKNQTTTYIKNYSYVTAASNYWYPGDLGTVEEINKKYSGTLSYDNITDICNCIHDPLNVEKIIDSIDIDNQYYKVSLTLHNNENTTNHARWQLLTYGLTGNSDYQGYHPDVEQLDWTGDLSFWTRNNGGHLSGNKMILVLDIKDKPFIYWGGEIYDQNSSMASNGYYYSVYRSKFDENGDKSSEYWFDFSPLSFATADNIKKYHKDYIQYQENLNNDEARLSFIGTLPVVAIPELYYNLGLRPTFYDLDGNLMTTNDRYTGTSEPSTYEFNGITYKVFCPSIYGLIVSKFSGLSSKSVSSYWCKTTLNIEVI